MKRSGIVRAVWASAALFTLAGFWHVQHHYERRIRLARTSAETLYAMTSANEQTIRQEGRLRVQRDAALRDLKLFGTVASQPSATANVLEAFERQARAHRAIISAVTPTALAQMQTAPGLIAMPVTLRVRGRFRDLLAFLVDVSSRTPLLEIRRTQLAPSQKAVQRGGPQLDAAIDAIVYRFAPSDSREELHAATP